MPTVFHALGLYIGLLGLIWLWLGVNVGQKRNQEKVFMGDGGNPRVIRAMRGHANFVESTPIALIILMIAATINTPIYIIHIAGVLLVIGRFLHAFHFIQDDAAGWQRMYGTILTIIVIAFGSLGLIGHTLVKLI